MYIWRSLNVLYVIIQQVEETTICDMREHLNIKKNLLKMLNRRCIKKFPRFLPAPQLHLNCTSKALKIENINAHIVRTFLPVQIVSLVTKKNAATEKTWKLR